MDSTSDSSNSSDDEIESPIISKSPLIRIYCDFDGTLTRAGGQTVWDTNLPLTVVGQTNDEIVAQLMNQEMAKHPTFQLENHARDFIVQMTQHPDVDFVIISRNFRAYIKAVMRHANISDDDIKATRIIDRYLFKTNKSEFIRSYEHTAPKVNYSFVFDDTSDDRNDITNTLSPYQEVIAPACAVGQFNWAALNVLVLLKLSEIKAMSPTPPHYPYDGDSDYDADSETSNEESDEYAKSLPPTPKEIASIPVDPPELTITNTPIDDSPRPVIDTYQPTEIKPHHIEVQFDSKKEFLQNLGIALKDEKLTPESILNFFDELKDKNGIYKAIHEQRNPLLDRIILFFKSKVNPGEGEQNFWHTATYQKAVKMLKETYLAKTTRTAYDDESERGKAFLDYFRGNTPRHHKHTTSHNIKMGKK